MSACIRKRKIDTNECPNIYSWPIYSNIRIFEYIRHTLLCIYRMVDSTRSDRALDADVVLLMCRIFARLAGFIPNARRLPFDWSNLPKSSWVMISEKTDFIVVDSGLGRVQDKSCVFQFTKNVLFPALHWWFFFALVMVGSLTWRDAGRLHLTSAAKIRLFVKPQPLKMCIYSKSSEGKYFGEEWFPENLQPPLQLEILQNEREASHRVRSYVFQNFPNV